MEIAAAPIRVLVVWEPVIWSDVAPPTDASTGRVADPRAVQFWDPARAVSRELVRVAGLPPDTIVWDFVAIYRPGSRWAERPPEALYHGYPVADVIAEVRAGLKDAAAAPR